MNMRRNQHTCKEKRVTSTSNNKREHRAIHGGPDG